MHPELGDERMHQGMLEVTLVFELRCAAGVPVELHVRDLYKLCDHVVQCHHCRGAVLLGWMRLAEQFMHEFLRKHVLDGGDV